MKFENFRGVIGNPLAYAHHLYLSNDENTEITNLVIPSSISSISDYAFYGCTGLTTVTIEKRDTPLIFDNSALGGCDNITDVYCYTETLPSGDGFVISNATLHVPESMVIFCKSTAPWNGFGEIVALTETGGKPKKGDVNEDGEVDISDIVAIINIIANGE